MPSFSKLFSSVKTVARVVGQRIASMAKPVGVFVSRYRRILGGVAGVVVIGLIVGYVAIPAPSAEGTMRGQTVEIHRNAQVRVLFTQDMDHASVEKAFGISPPVAGTFAWEKQTLVFQPNEHFEKGKTYDVTISTDAKNRFGKHLTSTFRQSFVVLDYPEVYVLTPTPNTMIREDQRVTVLFDHPVRALSNEAQTRQELVKIEPHVDGKYEWLGTQGFEFIPDKGWPGAMTFMVTVPKGFKLADGSTLIADATTTFSTDPMSVGLASVANHHRPENPFILSFRYPISIPLLKTALTIKAGDQVIPNDQLLFETEGGNAAIVRIRNPKKYELGKTYQLSMAKGFTGGVGTNGTLSDFSATITTDDPFFVMNGACPGDKDTKSVTAPVYLHFNNPIDKDTYKKAVKVIPEVKDLNVEVTSWWPTYQCGGISYSGGDDDDRTLVISGDWKPSANYQIIIDSQIKDTYHQPLKDWKNLAIKTAEYLPWFELSSQSDFGLLAAHLPRLYQLRTMNLHGQMHLELCRGAFGDEANANFTDCSSKVEKDIPTDGKLNEYHVIDLDFDKLSGTRVPLGAYQVSLLGGGVHDYDNRPVVRTFMIMNTSLTTKTDRDGAILVWATDLQTGEPIKNLPVDLYEGQRNYYEGFGKKMTTVTTNDDGYVLVSAQSLGGKSVGVVRVETSDRFGYVANGWNDGIDVWNYGLDYSYAASSTRHIGYIYTDRTIYRPEHKVSFKGMVRYDADAKLSVPKTKDVHVVIEDSEGKQVYDQPRPLSSFGTFNGEFQMDKTMALGTYQIYVSPALDPQSERQIAGSFDVREYRAPDFKVSVEVPDDVVTNGQSVSIPIRADYYYGAPLSKAKVNYEITRNIYFFQPMAGEWYSYNLEENYDCWWWCRAGDKFENVMSGEGTLDDQGRLVLNVPANLKDYKGSGQYTINATVTDISGRTVSYQSTFVVHKGEFYLGVRSNYSNGWGSSKMDFDAISLNVNQTVRSNTAFTAKLYKRTWTNVKKDSASGPTWEYEHQDEFVASQPVTTNADGKTSFSFEAAKQDGEYVVIVEATDAKGNAISASTMRYVYRSEQATMRVTDDHHLKIVQNKAEYKPGEKASIVVQLPYDSAKALVTVERAKIRKVFVMSFSKDQRTVEIPITEDDVPNVFVSILAVKGGGDTGVPEFRLGYANLQVSTSNKILGLEVKPDQDVYKPGQKVTMVVTTKKQDGSPVSAEVSIAVVDERIVALLGSVDKNILGKFWFPRLIGITTNQTLTRLVKKVFYSTEGGAGGGKGDAGVNAPPVRTNFLDTAYWKADVVTGADGSAVVSFQLPENLTSWQILAIGTTKDTIVGSTEKQIVTRKDVMVEPVVPRILRVEDDAKIGATVFNNTSQAVTLPVTLEAKGLDLKEAATKSLTLAPKTRVVALWNVHVPAKGAETKVAVRAGTAELGDGFEVTVPLLPYSVPEITSAAGIFEKTAKEQVEIPKNILGGQSDVTVSVSPSIGNNLQMGMEYLLKYPYGCSEQTSSAIVASLAFEQLVKAQITDASPEQKDAAKKKIEDGIAKLYPMQGDNGGWRYWSTSDYGSNYTYPHLSAYVFWVMTQTQQAGYSVDQSVIDRTDAYLRRVLDGREDVYWSWWNDQYAYNEKAQVLFMLSERNIDGLSGYAQKLYENRTKLSHFGKSFLAMAMGNIDKSSSARTQTLLTELKNGVVFLDPARSYVKEDEGYDYFMSSNVRSSSIYLKALLRLDPKNLEVERLVHWIVSQKQDGYWGTTQNTAMSLLSLVDYAKARGVDRVAMDVSVFLDNQVVQTMKFPNGDVSAEQKNVLPIQNLLKSGTTHDIGFEKSSDKRYFYDINLRVFKQIKDIPAFENGFSMTSQMYAMDDKKSERPISSAKQGDLVRVKMKVIVPKSRSYVSLEHHLPAGLEAVDFTLKTSPQNVSGNERACRPTWWGESYCFGRNQWEWDWYWENAWDHIEFRDDRVFLFANRLSPGVYEYEFVARAVTPGTFHVPPARVYEMYNPEANAHNEGRMFTVTP